MFRRRGLQAGLAILAVAVLSLSGLLTEQVWSESQARGQLATARQEAYAALTHARYIGLHASEVAPFRARARHIDAAPAPDTTPFWRARATQFYSSQAKAYTRLRASLLAEEARLTETARSRAGSDLASLDRAMTEATGLGLDVSASQSALQQQKSTFSSVGSRNPTPGAYRLISSKLASVASSLAAQIKGRRAYLLSIVAAGKNTAAGVQSVADRDAAAAGQDLDLLSALTQRAAAYRTQIAGLLAAVHAQQDPMQAAIREAALHDEVAAVHADFSKTVPAKMIVVSTEDQSANVYQNGRDIYSTPVTTGGPELPTDHGVFHIYLKLTPFVFHSPWPPSSPYYYPPTPIQYWMPFDQGEGLHDASWRSNFGPGSNLAPTDLGTGRTILGTHGCVNLPYDAATFIWNWAPVGTTVVVV